MSVEYTHLLTSQLESQRAYFEEKVERAADKASEASAAAAVAQKAAQQATSELTALTSKYDSLINETIPVLERDKERAEKRSQKSESLARNMQKQWQEEKTMNTSLMVRIDHLTSEVTKLKAENEDVKEQNRDLSFFISGSERLKNQSEDVVGGSRVREPLSRVKTPIARHDLLTEVRLVRFIIIEQIGFTDCRISVRPQKSPKNMPSHGFSAKARAKAHPRFEGASIRRVSLNLQIDWLEQK
ncbi:hypothetical protein KEM56_006441 [Ascosphaera pollenicola]|nr:hypothetical protein KEM56_006441 [Ascosphaera pollenicola]